MFQLKFISLIFLISISLLVISFPLSAADNKNNYDQSSGNTSQQKSQQQSEMDDEQKKRLSPDHHQSDYDSYKESDSKVDHHNTRDHTDAMH
jgi:hypothetical protein